MFIKHWPSLEIGMNGHLCFIFFFFPFFFLTKLLVLSKQNDTLENSPFISKRTSDWHIFSFAWVLTFSVLVYTGRTAFDSNQMPG